MKKVGRPKHSSRAKIPVIPELHKELLELISSRQLVPQENVHENLLRAYTILYHTGMRISELIQLDSQMIWEIMYGLNGGKPGKTSLDNSTKTRKPRLIVISKAGINDLKEIFDGLWTEEEAKKKHKIFKIKAPSLTKTVNKYMKMVDPSLSSHSYRQGIITQLLNKKISPKIVQQFIGHEQINTTLNYNFITTQNIFDVIEEVRK